uniref:RxLR effector candidate protein n=1 Tax=Hyaloperonospora arabidopsidis (strain Emoy2) TaxID=559515 RepID=M4C048_HYAAE
MVTTWPSSASLSLLPVSVSQCLTPWKATSRRSIPCTCLGVPTSTYGAVDSMWPTSASHSPLNGCVNIRHLAERGNATIISTQ